MCFTTFLLCLQMSNELSKIRVGQIWICFVAWNALLNFCVPSLMYLLLTHNRQVNANSRSRVLCICKIVLASLVLIPSICGRNPPHRNLAVHCVHIKSYVKFSSVNQMNFMKHNFPPISIGKDFYFKIGILVLNSFSSSHQKILLHALI